MFHSLPHCIDSALRFSSSPAVVCKAVRAGPVFCGDQNLPASREQGVFWRGFQGLESLFGPEEGGFGGVSRVSSRFSAKRRVSFRRISTRFPSFGFAFAARSHTLRLFVGPGVGINYCRICCSSSGSNWPGWGWLG